MKNERPEALTPRGVVVDVAVSVALLLGTALVTLIERQLPSVPAATGVVLILLELALVFFAIGYALRAATYLWDQFSFLVERVANSATWTRLKAGFAWVLGWVLRALRALLKIAEAIIAILILYVIVDAVLTHFGIKLWSGPAGIVAPKSRNPEELAPWVVLVIGFVVAAWLIRGVSVLVQQRWRAALS